MVRRISLKKLKVLGEVRNVRGGKKDNSIREVGRHLLYDTNNHRQTHVLVCCLTERKEKQLKIEKESRIKESLTLSANPLD